MKNIEQQHIEILKKIDAYLNGEMSESERDDFWDEVIANPDYYENLEFEAALRSLIKEQQTASDSSNNSDSKPPSSGSFPSKSQRNTATIYSLKRYTGWIVAVAAVVVLVLGINLLRVSSPTSPANRVALLDNLDRIGSFDMFDMESVAATRGDDGEEDPFAILFDKSLIAAFSDENTEALRLYEELIEKYPDDIRTGKAYMNAGIIYYNQENYEQAAVYFKEATERADDVLFEEKAWWFKANAELVSKDYEMARYSMYMTYGFSGVYSREAFRQLRILDAYLGYIDFEDIDPEIIDP